MPRRRNRRKAVAALSHKSSYPPAKFIFLLDLLKGSVILTESSPRPV